MGQAVPASDLPELAASRPVSGIVPPDDLPVGSLADLIPGGQQVTPPAAPSPSFGDILTAGAEDALTLATGATTGAAGFILGGLNKIASQVIKGELGTPEAVKAAFDEAMQGAAARTYEPRTPLGQGLAQATGEVAQQAIPLAGMGPQVAALGQAARTAVPAAAARVREAARPIAQAAGRARPGASAGPGSVGASATAAPVLRQAKAEELPVPIKLTEGQKTRDPAQVKFEAETAKGELGEPIRQRFATQREQMVQNMDAFIDSTGAETTAFRDVGSAVDKALRDRAARDKVKIRSLYKEAEKAGEMEAPVTLDTVIQHLNDSTPEAEVANVLKAVRAKALKLGLAVEDDTGTLIAQPVSLKTGELFRRSINDATGIEPTNIRQASILKGLYDEATAEAGGSLYKQARRERARYAANYENIGLIKNILGLKRGSSDRAIALEDVARKSVIDPSTSLDTVRQLRRLLQTEGENGQQAWKELQGATLRHIKEESLNITPDERGTRSLSPAKLDRILSTLDKSGKLDFVFGKKGAEQLRTINDVAKDVLTVPPSAAVNTSNTAATILAALDMGISGSAGVPAPVLSSLRLIAKGIKNAKTKARVAQALK